MFLSSLICRLEVIWAPAHSQVIMRIKWIFPLASIKDDAKKKNYFFFPSSLLFLAPNPIPVMFIIISMVLGWFSWNVMKKGSYWRRLTGKFSVTPAKKESAIFILVTGSLFMWPNIKILDAKLHVVNNVIQLLNEALVKPFCLLVLYYYCSWLVSKASVGLCTDLSKTQLCLSVRLLSLGGL